jgi:hypothetical protein
MPEHVQAVLPSVAAHRLVAREGSDDVSGTNLAEMLTTAVPVPV